MISLAEASARILAAVPAGAAEDVPPAATLGRYAARPVLASRALPGFDGSAMDGYAIHAADCGATPWLEVIGRHAAGDPATLRVAPGQAVRIFTGAPVPTDAGAVVMQEEVDAVSRPGSIQVREPAGLGEFIRRAGSDVCPGQILLHAGERCMASHVGLLATQGLRHVPMNVRPNIAILTTGNELLAADQVPTHAGQIYDSNGLMLQALVQQHGLAASVTLAHAADDLPTLVGTMETLLAAADVLICVGGMSVGEHDYVKPALAQIGVETDFWRVAMKPGKPFLFGHHGGKAIFGLPGNPVSAYVTAFLLVLPALRKMCGAREPAPLAISATLAASVSNRDQRPHYVRGRWEAAGTFTPLGLQESHALHGLSLANALLPVEPGAALSAGQAVWILPLGAGAGQKS